MKAIGLTKRELWIGAYLSLFLMLLCIEPATDAIVIWIGYYVIVFANLINAARLARETDKRTKK